LNQLAENSASFDEIYNVLSVLGGPRQIRDIAPIEEWVKSPFFLGSEAETLYPYWADVLVDFCSGPFNEIILGGSLRSGKSHTALLLAIRKLYELSCYYPIPSMFNLSSTSLVLFMYLSLSLTQANMLGLGRIRRMLDRIPYFKKNFPRNTEVDSLIKFDDPALMMIGGSSLGHFKGSDLFFLIFDEANFAKGSVEMKFGNAVEIYRESSIRRKSTFSVEGIENGIGVIVSSADTQTSFVEKHIKEVKNDPSVMIINAVAYEVQPSRYRNMGTFLVFEGDELVDPFLPEEDVDSSRNFWTVYKINPQAKFDISEYPPELQVKFRRVPNTFIQAFRKDIFGSLKDVCGIAVGQEGRFFSNRVKYNEAFPKGSEDQHPFTKETITVSYLDLDKIEYWFKKGVEFDPNMIYFGGIDQSVVNDCTGIALGHIDPKNTRFALHMDFFLQILPPKKPGKISPEKVADFFIWLKKEKDVRNLKMSQDWYAAPQTTQTFHLEGIDSEIFSVDRNWDAYRSFAGSILDGNVSGYNYTPFKEELFDLLQNNETKKVDHPAGGSKDVTDAGTHVHSQALNEYMELKGGVKFVQEFGAKNIKKFEYQEHADLVGGLWFGPGPFYFCWMFPMWKEDKFQLYVLDEYVDFSSQIETRVDDIRRRTATYNRHIKIGADPTGRIKGDHSKTSPLMQYRKAGLSVRCRKTLDRMYFEGVRNTINEIDDNGDPCFFVQEDRCPIMINALRRAKFKMRRKVVSGSLELTEETYPLFALRFGLEEAMTKSTITGY